MVKVLTDQEIERFRTNLQNRLNDLRHGVQEEVVRSDSEHFTDVAGEVHDQEEASVAHLVIDMDLANIDRHVQEIRAIESALLRIARGEFGICLDCGQPIPIARLEANPTAERCISCQVDYERTEALTSPPPSSL
jgi:RNA polymerase-binding protein DksA